MTMPKLRIGVVGLGRGFTSMLPTFVHDKRVRLVAATDRIAGARTQFERDFNAPSYDSIEALCADPAVQVVYVATPHQLHAEHVSIAASFGKHVLVEKPMALTVMECTQMIEAARQAGVHLIVGPSHSFDHPIRRTRELIQSGRYGEVKMITAAYFTDFLYRPRRPEELVTSLGGGVVHSQASHQMDIVRLLGGGLVSSVRAHTGNWDPQRSTEGAYSAVLGFESGAFATAVYSGYAHYDSDVLMHGIGEAGRKKNPQDYGSARQRLAEASASPEQEAALKAARNYGGSLSVANTTLPADLAYQHFGHIVVSCEGADLRPTPTGIEIYADRKKTVEPLPQPLVPRAEVIDELCATVLRDQPAIHSGEWARATTELCLAVLDSANARAEMALHYQVAVRQALPT